MVWKGIKVAAGFYTPMCEQGQMHVDKVKLTKSTMQVWEEEIIHRDSAVKEDGERQEDIDREI